MTITVGPTGCDYSSIQAAIDSASSGDTIEVRAGTYMENLTIGKSLTLKGINPQQVILKSTTAGKAAMHIAGLAVVTVEGITITGVKKLAGAEGCGEAVGVSVEGQAKATFQNSRITDNTPCTGIVVADSAQVFIQANSIVSGNRWGVVIFGRANIAIQNSEILNNEYIGVQVAGSAGSEITIQNNEISYNGTGIYVSESAEATIRGNIITNSAWHGIELREYAKATIRDNTITGSECGIYIWDSAQATIQDNTISGIEHAGIHMWDSSQATIQNNTITGSECGIYIGDSAQAEINGNRIINNNGYGVVVIHRDCYDTFETFKGAVRGSGNTISLNKWEDICPSALRFLKTSIGGCYGPKCDRVGPSSAYVPPLSGPPEILKIEFPSRIIGDGRENLGKVYFRDADADINHAYFKPVGGTGNWSPFDFDPEVEGETEGSFDFIITCETDERVTARFKVTLIDDAGNTSKPVYFSFSCVRP